MMTYKNKKDNQQYQKDYWKKNRERLRIYHKAYREINRENKRNWNKKRIIVKILSFDYLKD